MSWSNGGSSFSPNASCTWATLVFNFGLVLKLCLLCIVCQNQNEPGCAGKFLKPDSPKPAHMMLNYVLSLREVILSLLILWHPRLWKTNILFLAKNPVTLATCVICLQQSVSPGLVWACFWIHVGVLFGLCFHACIHFWWLVIWQSLLDYR